MSVSVKAYLLILPEQQEIRRFSIDEGASANYDYLVIKIRSVFPNIGNQPLRLFWKDEDGELVTFSSHEELITALGSIQGDVFRVYIKVLDIQEDTGEQEAPDNSSTSEPGPVHVGVVCDGCNQDIVGIRFKCVVCPDYDLCMKCEAKGLHKQHEMMRICTPRARANQWFSAFCQPPQPSHPVGPHDVPGFTPHHPTGFGPHHPRPAWVGPHHPRPAWVGPHHPPGFGPHLPPGFEPWGRGRAGFSWRQNGGTQFARGRCGGPRGRCGKSADAKSADAKSADAKCERHTEKTSDAQEVPVGPPFLHAMGEAIASFLGPMGIEVHTYSDTDQDCCTGKCECDHSETKTEETAETTSAQEAKDAENCDQECHAPPSSSPEKTDGTAPTEDYVMIDKDKQKDTEATEKSDAAMDTSAEDKPEDKPEDPLEVAIAQMKAMGFHDHDGWLTHLIVAKEYDIGKVLDAIQYTDKN